MQFEYTCHGGARSPVTDASTFCVDALKRMSRSRATDVSHLIDRSYEYHSLRELRWHLAERFGVTPAIVAMRRVA